ncbi:O-antigen ligase-like membrane protein [Thiobaca trueperi]|uniref:O-antigen ligase-like membrane protein n=2 Tax=Thiobaca trueperi TaxID=127458 RepID=A0A4R3N7P0_9GAMM|nr:O-antigen ligase-like membrane protein [Thiobaca trueperi]
MNHLKKNTLQSEPKTGITTFLFLLIYFFLVSYAYLFLFKNGGPKPLYYYLAFIAISAFIAIINISSPNIPKDRRFVFFQFWVVIYVIYFVTHVIFSPYPDIALPALIINFEALLIAICAIHVSLTLKIVRASMWVMGLAAILAIPLNILDFFDPIFTAVPGRSAGFYENPTISGQMIALMMVAGIPIFKKKIRTIFVLFCGLAILLTFSRAAWIFWLVGFFWMLSQNELKTRTHVKSIFAFFLVLMLSAFLFSGFFGKMITGSKFEHYLTPNTMARLGIGGKVMSGDSYEDRENLIKHSIKDFSEAPLFGHGIGYTEAQRRRPHNMYLLFMSEGGIIGLFIYGFFIFSLWFSAHGLGKPLVIILAISGLFTHNNLEQPAMMLVSAFIVAHGALSRHEANRKK